MSSTPPTSTHHETALGPLSQAAPRPAGSCGSRPQRAFAPTSPSPADHDTRTPDSSQARSHLCHQQNAPAGGGPEHADRPESPHRQYGHDVSPPEPCSDAPSARRPARPHTPSSPGAPKAPRGPPAPTTPPARPPRSRPTTTAPAQATPTLKNPRPIRPRQPVACSSGGPPSSILA